MNTYTIALAAGGAIVLLTIIGYGISRYFGNRAEEDVEDLVDAPDENPDKPGQTVELETPEIRSGIIHLLKIWWHRTRAKKLAEKGYVKWYKLDATMKRPKWVKPRYDGTGEGEYYDSADDVTYLFPKDAMVPDAQTGAWTAIHLRNEADPINLRDGLMPAVPADRLQELINLEAESEEPGFFDKHYISGTTLFIIVTVILFLVYAATQVLGGGI